MWHCIILWVRSSVLKALCSLEHQELQPCVAAWLPRRHKSQPHDFENLRFIICSCNGSVTQPKDKFYIHKISFVQLSQFSSFICNQSSVLTQYFTAYYSCTVTDQLMQHYETSFFLDRDYQALCRRTVCPTYTTAGGQSGMATTTVHTMGTVTLAAAPVGIHGGVRIMTPTSEWYWNSSMYLLQSGVAVLQGLFVSGQ